MTGLSRKLVALFLADAVAPRNIEEVLSTEHRGGAMVTPEPKQILIAGGGASIGNAIAAALAMPPAPAARAPIVPALIVPESAREPIAPPVPPARLAGDLERLRKAEAKRARRRARNRGS